MNRLAQLEANLSKFSINQRRLPGIAGNAARRALAMQMIASLRRLDYTTIIRDRSIDPRRVDPNNDMFDPERAAIIHSLANRLDEAVWLIFLATHFGRHPRHGWRRLRDVYSGLGAGTWTWDRVSRDVPGFRAWLRDNREQIRGGFGNHRKYESLDADSVNGTGEVVATYVAWIGPERSHSRRFATLVHAGGNDPHRIFDCFYRDMNVTRFGRLAKFDFLALLGRLGLAPINPGSTYLSGATGPLRGARLLFGGSPSSNLKVADLETWISDLDEVLKVGMQVMEDSLCNWQKSPSHFVHFRG
jgi:hypothetical protein